MVGFQKKVAKFFSKKNPQICQTYLDAKLFLITVWLGVGESADTVILAVLVRIQSVFFFCLLYEFLFIVVRDFVNIWVFFFFFLDEASLRSISFSPFLLSPFCSKVS